MTKEEIFSATARQLRVMVAEALGWTWVTNTDYVWMESPGVVWDIESRALNEHRRCERPEEFDDFAVSIVPDWPNDIAVAWQLIIDSHSKGWLIGIDNDEGKWNCWICGHTVFEQITPEIAICRAWLLATRDKLEL